MHSLIPFIAAAVAIPVKILVLLSSAAVNVRDLSLGS